MALFLVSSRLQKGRVEYVHLLSEKGRPCTMANPWPGKSIQLFRNGRKAEVLSGAVVHFNTAVEETIRMLVVSI